MKRKIIMALVAISLLMGGLSGIVYAHVSHQPLPGEKLLGTGPMGTSPASGNVFGTVFRITNPDDVEDITIKRISILEGNVGWRIYEGPLVRVSPGGDREIVTTLAPHEIIGISLARYMWKEFGEHPKNVTDPGNWLTPQEAITQNTSSYTVEIAWEARGSSTPLIGWQRVIVRVDVGGEGTELRTATETQMVNLKQK